MQLATIFFLPLEDRPKDYPPLKNFKGRFWHVGIILNDKVYQCFNNRKWKISGLGELEDAANKKAILIRDVPVKAGKLISEIESGTDCAEYIARCVGLSKLKGEDKGNLYPEDIYRLLLKQFG